MPSTPTLLYHLLAQALSSSGKFKTDRDPIYGTLNEINTSPKSIGFEITLNNFWHMCACYRRLMHLGIAQLDEFQSRPGPFQ